MKSAIYVLIYALLIQLGLVYAVPDSWVYGNRVEYDVIKNNMATDLGVAMDRVARDIRQHPDRDYAILIGDSVTYSGPGRADQSIGYYLEQYSQTHGHPLKVYNFAQPGMAGGDVYAEVLMLKAHHVPLERVVLNQVYADFAYHAPTETMVEWLGDELHRLDPEGWQIAHGGAMPQAAFLVRLRQRLLNGISLWQYRDFLRARLHLTTSAEVKDTRPWTEKKLWLTALMKDPTYQRWVAPKPMDLTAANPQVQLFERTLGALKGSQVLVWFAPFNRELMAEGVARPGYQENAAKLDAFFAGHPVTYLPLRDAVDPALFTDHTHLVPAGYEQVAARLGEQLLAAKKP